MINWLVNTWVPKKPDKEVVTETVPNSVGTRLIGEHVQQVPKASKVEA